MNTADSDAEISARIRARMEADMADPEWQASMKRSLEDARAGRVLPASFLFLPLPRWGWLWHVLFQWIAPRTWGRKAKKAYSSEQREAK